MNIFEMYSKRVGISGRSSVDASIKSSINNMERNFHTSPSYYKVDIDGEAVDTIINKTNDHNIKLIHFRHEYKAQIGNVITFDDKKYLLMEIDRDVIYSFGKMEECNNTMEVQDGESERVLIGENQHGAPVYDYVTNYKDEPCIVRDRYYSSNENAQLPLPDGKLEITLRYQEISNIQVNEEFEMYGKTYKIADISSVGVQDGVGVMKVHAERRLGKHE